MSNIYSLYAGDVEATYIVYERTLKQFPDPLINAICPSICFSGSYFYLFFFFLLLNSSLYMNRIHKNILN